MTYELQPVGKNYDMVIFDGDVVAGAWSLLIDALNFCNCYYTNGASTADGDEFTLPLVLGKGTYDIHLVYFTNANCGKLDVELDGTVIINQLDTYTAGAVYNNIHEESAVEIGGGLHTLGFKVNGKNAASSDYLMSVTLISFRKVA